MALSQKRKVEDEYVADDSDSENENSIISPTAKTQRRTPPSSTTSTFEDNIAASNELFRSQLELERERLEFEKQKFAATEEERKEASDERRALINLLLSKQNNN